MVSREVSTEFREGEVLSSQCAIKDQCYGIKGN